jgi:TonB family protein
MDRPTDPRSPVQSQRSSSCLPFVLAGFAGLAFWTWQNSETAIDWWDADQPKAAEGPTRAKTNLVQYFSTDDYPADAIRNNEQGTVSFRLTVSRRGRVADCHIVHSSDSITLDRATCGILEDRARFTPARNAEGKRVPDEYTGRIRWELPEE